MKNEVSTIRAALDANIPVLIWGSPGTGKTATISSLAKEYGAHLEVLIGSTIDPTDIARPVIDDNNEVQLSAAPWARRLRQVLDSGKSAWLFLDEFSCVPPSVQAALLRVVQERVVGDVSLEGCRFIAAANGIDQAAGGWELAAATANRWLHLDWNIDFEEWAAGELAGWGESRSESHAQASALVVSFIRHRPQALLECPADPVNASRGWPSPRAWSNAAKMLALSDNAKLFEWPVARLALNGLVGEATTREFFVWVVDQNLPAPADLIAGKAEIPQRGDRQRAAVEGAIAYAVNKNLDSNSILRLIVKTRKDVMISLGRTYINAMNIAKKEIVYGKEFEEIIDVIRGVAGVRAQAKVAYARK